MSSVNNWIAYLANTRDREYGERLYGPYGVVDQLWPAIPRPEGPVPTAAALRAAGASEALAALAAMVKGVQ